SRNIFLLIASYIFYGWWSPVFLILIFITSVSSFASGLMVEQSSREWVRKVWLWGNVALNLGILCTYKYFNFFSASFVSMMKSIGWEVDSITLDLILPVGISFYTFQALSYVIDVKRKQIRATRDFFAFMAFISFFPQLVAGPIERATNLLPQFLRNRRFDYGKGVEGMRLILWGLFKKMVIADNCAPMADKIFEGFQNVGSLNLWIGAFLFTIQIYCDFSGYSDIARGVARLFGVELMHNFRLPYFSKDIKEFWQKWHISLTSWFRDYLYIPLGGNRKGKWKRIRNTVIVFLTSGLWHGANFTFIAWGGYHAILYLPSMIAKKKGGNGDNRHRGYIRSVLAMGITFLLVMIGWILFRARHISEAFEYIRMMFAGLPSGEVMGKRAVAWCLFLLIAEWIGRRNETPVDLFSKGLGRFTAIRWSLYLILFLVILVFSGNTEQFIYFQF
ncbi:MAG: MBOAT family protein, partial [Muribaculaceae bacterium]|nr:MBOAT family protein [Muribaculaceae bacterium]